MARIDTWLESQISHRPPGYPLVSLCYAQSLDGSLAVARGQPLVLSGVETSLLTHRLRALHDAILVGVGTVIADDPRLTVRLVEGVDPQPVILDSGLSTPLSSNLVQAHPRRPWIFTAPDANPANHKALESAGVQVYSVLRSKQGGLDLLSILAHLEKQGIRSLMVEGGAQVISSFLSLGLANIAIITIAPLFVGGLPVLEPGVLQRSADFPRLVNPQIEALGDDCVIFGEISNS